MSRALPILVVLLVAPFAAADVPEAVITSLREHAIPVADAAAPPGARLDSSLGDARVVGVGMAAPGSRACFQVGRQLLERLVEEHGFTVIALSTSFPDCIALDEYVVHGTGDPEAALFGQGYWTWDNETMLDVVRWMRRYNADPRNERTLRLYGLDMQNADTAIDAAVAYVARSDARAARQLARSLEPLRGLEIFRSYPTWEEDRRSVLRRAAENLGATLDHGRDEMVAASSIDEWRLARQHAEIVRQNEHWVRVHFVRDEGGDSVTAARERALAANAAWILEREGPDARMLIWAHNTDVARVPFENDEPTLGRELAAALGDRYRAVAVTFHRGEVQAIHAPIEYPADYVQTLAPRRVPEPPREQLESTLASAAGAPFALDLRRLAAQDPLRAWLDEPQSMWLMGSGYAEPRAVRGDYGISLVVRGRYDALIFVGPTAATRPNARTLARFSTRGPERP